MTLSLLVSTSLRANVIDLSLSIVVLSDNKCPDSITFFTAIVLVLDLQ